MLILAIETEEIDFQEFCWIIKIKNYFKKVKFRKIVEVELTLLKKKTYVKGVICN